MISKCQMNSKWKIKGIDSHLIAENGDLYKKPFEKDLKSYSWRKIKLQAKNRYLINGVWYSQTRLRPLLYLDPNPTIIFEINEMPF